MEQLSRLADKFKSIAQFSWNIGNSNIHGKGIFAAKSFKPGEVIELALKDNGNSVFSRTTFAQFINHQPESNIILKKINNDYYFVANKNIKSGEEFVTNYSDYELQMWDENVREVL